MIPYSKQYIDNDDIKAVVNVLKSPFITQGPNVENFEKNIANFVGAKYAVAVNSGTSALHIAYLAAGLNSNKKFITSSNTFVATPNAAIYCGAIPHLYDINPEDGNFFHDKKNLNFLKKFDFIVPVHFAGNPCDVDLIRKYVGKDKIIIEDASHGLGGFYKNKKRIGSCYSSDMTVFSFHPVKPITTGEGGVITTNNLAFYKKLLRLRSHGINKLDDGFELKIQAVTNKVTNPWYYEMQTLGYNYRMSDIQAALGLSQLKKIDKFREKKKKLFHNYNKLIEHSKHIFKPPQVDSNLSAHHLYVLRINFYGEKNRANLMNFLRKKGIGSQVHYIPIFMHPFYKKKFRNISKNFINMLSYYDSCLSIPFYYDLKFYQQKYVIKTIESFFNE
jgi:UDP-4-amino-4,6-dideoxy-N-acetyl-beta-L-altrosamine transaminase